MLTWNERVIIKKVKRRNQRSSCKTELYGENNQFTQ